MRSNRSETGDSAESPPRRDPASDGTDPASTSTTARRSRRGFLRAGSVAGVTLLAGCTEDIGSELPPNAKWPTSELVPSLPFETRGKRLEARIESAASEDVEGVETFTDVVADRVPSLESIEETRDVLEVAYVMDVRRLAGTGDDVASIAGAYSALVETGYDAYALGTTILEAASDPVGSAVVYTDWAKQYNSGALTTGEYAELVSTTIESTRHPPTIEVEPDE